MFAAHTYIERRGAPRSFEDFQNRDVVGYDCDDQIIRGFAAAGFGVDRRFFSLRCDNQVVCWRFVVAGFGIGFNQMEIGEAEPGVAQLHIDAALPTLPIWLTAHAELKTSRRVRRVFDFLGEHLRQVSG